MAEPAKNSEAALRQAFKQFLCYGLVGITINLGGYLCYLLLTDRWFEPKFAMTLLYLLGAGFGFFLNRRITFQHRAGIGQTGVRYVFAQFAGYILNFLLLWIFVDYLGFPHQWVQACAILLVAIFLFVVYRSYVFASRPELSGGSKK